MPRHVPTFLMMLAAISGSSMPSGAGELTLQQAMTTALERNRTIAAFSAKASAAQARQEALSGEHNIAMVEEGVRLEVRSAFAQVQTAGKRHLTAGRAVNAAREALRVREKRFEQGLDKMIDLLDAETTLRESGLRELVARYDLALSTYRLYFTSGTSLTALFGLDRSSHQSPAARPNTSQKVIEVHGIVQPARQAFVSSRVMGPVVAVKTWAGASVSKGQILIEIQPETSKGRVAQAEGALAQARAALALAERNLKRFEALYTEKAVSEVEMDIARMQHDQAKGAVDQALGAVHTVKIVAGEAGVTAPFAARVVERLVEVGDMATPGRPLIRLESLEGRRLWLSVREADIGRLELDQKIPVTLDSRADNSTIEGTVVEIVPAADPATHTFTVKVDLGSVDVPSGISGRASIPGDTVERVVIPATAVHARGGLELVVVRADDASARTRAVTTGRALPDGRVEILSGIKPGDSVVVDAPGPVADGTPLEVRPETPMPLQVSS